MPISLLATKLYIPPPRPNLVPRPRLIERLNAGLHGKLTLISAPAGFGKTTLVAEWLSQLTIGHSQLTIGNHPVAWLSLDEGDNDPARFFAYLVAALQTVLEHIGASALAALQSPRPLPMEAVLTGLINEITTVGAGLAPAQGDREGRPYVLVLDDYHLISNQPIHQALTFLLDHLPPTLHLVIATRADPPLPLARLRARGQLTELRAADLRFTSEETASFFNRVMGLNLSAADAAMLESRTEGWVAGLQMAALAMQAPLSPHGQGDISGFIAALTGSDRYILDYLVEEVLQQQPEPVQTFLLQTSILDRLIAPLCDAVTGLEDGSSQTILEMLERGNLFITPLDNERRWYRYHRLFADLLRSRLHQAYPDLTPTLHRRASEWFEQTGHIAEAGRHALAAGDFERAADLIERTAWKMLTRGEVTTLLNWLEALPHEVVCARPRLGLFRAWALTLTSQLDRAEQCLQETDTAELEGEAAAVRAYAARFRGDAARAIELSRQALQHLPEEALFLRSLMAMNLGNAYWLNGDPEAAGSALVEAVSLGRAAGDSYLALIASSLLGQAQEMAGRLHQAAETYEQALQLASEPGSRPAPFAGLTHVGLAGPLYEWNDLDGAHYHTMKGIALGERGGSVNTLQGGYVMLAKVHQARGDVDGALEALHEAGNLAHSNKLPHVIALVSALQTRLRLEQGEVAASSRWMQESGLISSAARRTSADDELSYVREIEHLTLARVLIAQDRPGEALRLLARPLKAAQAAGRMRSVIEILALQALACQAQGDSGQAMSTLEQMLSLAEPEGYVRTFLDEGEAMAGLLQQALSQGISPSYAAALLAAFNAEATPPSPALAALVEPLSERELEVLRLIVAGLSNPEIAEELVIAVSTVKTHVNHIYGKLGVTSRTRAVAKARELGLL